MSTPKHFAKQILADAYGVAPSSKPKLSKAAQAVADYLRDAPGEHAPDSAAANLAAALTGEAITRAKPVASKPSADMQEAVDRAVAESLARRGIR